MQPQAMDGLAQGREPARGVVEGARSPPKLAQGEGARPPGRSSWVPWGGLEVPASTALSEKLLVHTHHCLWGPHPGMKLGLKVGSPTSYSKGAERTPPSTLYVPGTGTCSTGGDPSQVMYRGQRVSALWGWGPGVQSGRLPQGAGRPLPHEAARGPSSCEGAGRSLLTRCAFPPGERENVAAVRRNLPELGVDSPAETRGPPRASLGPPSPCPRRARAAEARGTRRSSSLLCRPPMRICGPSSLTSRSSCSRRRARWAPCHPCPFPASPHCPGPRGLPSWSQGPRGTDSSGKRAVGAWGDVRWGTALVQCLGLQRDLGQWRHPGKCPPSG